MERAEYDALIKHELRERIQVARERENAVILAHNYQIMDVQRLADFTGDSLELARRAAETDADTIVFCGVDFMAESAKILSPDRKVLLPEINATCPMAHMADPKEVEALKEQHPGALVVTYVNSTAETKAVTDVCVTSSNAVTIVNKLKDRPIIFLPDKNLGNYVRKMTGAEIIPWEGYCYVHNELVVDDVELAKRKHPEAVLLVHPEAPPEVVDMADEVLSTSGMHKYVAALADAGEKRRGVIIGTEIGLVERLQEDYPDVNIHPLSSYAVCRNMKRTTLAALCWSIENGAHEITLPGDVMDRARRALERMLELS